MKRVALLTLLAAAALLMSSPAQAVTFMGSLSTATAPSGIVGSGGSWTDNFMITWKISDETNPGTWTYEYWVTQEDGVSALGTNGQQGGLSHWTLEVSSGLTEDDFTMLAGTLADVGADPTSPAPQFYGLKMDPSGDGIYFAFTVERAPVWGDFFAKDGSKGGEVWNSGYSANDPDPNNPFVNADGKILRPDTFPTTQTPEPGTMLLLGLGLAGGAVVRRFKK